MFDVFYIGIKPNLFPHEQEVDSVEQAQAQCRTRYFWLVNYLCAYPEGFDFMWEPEPWESEYRHAWASQWQSDAETYLVPRAGYTETVYHESPVLKRVQSPDDPWEMPTNIDDYHWDFTWHPDPAEPPMVHEFGTQWQPTGGPRYVPPGYTEQELPIKLESHPRAVASRAISDRWQTPIGAEYSNFDYTWHPDRRDPAYVYQFGTQHQKTGGPRYVVPEATEVKYVENIKITTSRSADAIVIVDHLEGMCHNLEYTLERRGLPVEKRVRFFNNYLDTITRICRNSESEYLWIVSSLCDYDTFDFTWHPETWQARMIHVFPSDEQKFGDTFFVHVPSFLEKSKRAQLLEWMDVNFVKDYPVGRWPVTLINHEFDSQADAVHSVDFPGPMAVFNLSNPTPQGSWNFSDSHYDGMVPAINLWRQETQTIEVLSNDGHIILVPKTSVPHIKEQIYDYPQISRRHSDLNPPLDPLDIVFISNGETNADKNWEHLTRVTEHLPNRLVRVNGIDGRVAAYHAALKASSTPWAFCVFAKLEVNPEFDFGWQPDRLQQPKHYIFNARNPVTGLEYGHMAMIAYNKRLVLENTGEGLDFTLDSAHEVVPLLSGTADYAHDAWIAWRSSFRECIKLKHSLPDIDAEYRLNSWLNNDLTGSTVGDWSRQGASDAVEYYNSVQGKFEALKRTYDWAWLEEYLQNRHGLTPEELSNIRL